jgi:multidrug resistance efflux pump
MTEKDFKRPSIRYRRRHILRQLFAGWPWLIWLAAAIMVLVLLPGGWHRVRFYGEAERTYEYVAPLVDGRLVTLNIEPGNLVHTNQLVGQLESAVLETDWLMDQASLMKTYDRIQQIQCEIQEKKLQEAETLAKLKELEGRWAHSQELLKKKLILEQDQEDLRPQIKATQQILVQYPTLIDRLKKRLVLAEKSATLFSADRLEALKKAQYQLRTTTSGVVSEILHRPGDIVKTGDPVARISNITTTRIIAFLPAETRIDVQPGKSCQVISSTTREMYQARVESVTADIRKLPMFTGFGDRVQRGRRVLIILDGGREITPGERVVVVPDRSVFDQWFGGKK